MASSTTAATSTPKFSAGSDEQALSRMLEPLLESAGRGGRWTLTPSGEGLERSFKFKTFAKTWDFMTAVSLHYVRSPYHYSQQPPLPPNAGTTPFFTCHANPSKDYAYVTAQSMPKLTSMQVYNTTYIRWTTHNPQGMSAKDVELAAVCDGLARDFGEIAEEGGGGATGEMRRLADRGAASAGDCCRPKK
ncbi:hypothetical protein DL769_002079 [Monosporascus sp. CRB-8-3]|nr:hypothetical protein DL769_002079 [Monosporascus sp. CRB-8-3]